MYGLFKMRNDLYNDVEKKKRELYNSELTLSNFNSNYHHLRDFDINDIIINKKPYEGEAPCKIIRVTSGLVYCAELNRDFTWDNDFTRGLRYEELQYYNKITDYNNWLLENKDTIIKRWKEHENFLLLNQKTKI